MRIMETSLKGILIGETREERKQDIDFLLRKNPRKCICCGEQLTAEDILGSQGDHCQLCWSNLRWDEEGFWCAIHDKDVRYIRVWPLFDAFLQLDNIEDFEGVI